MILQSKVSIDISENEIAEYGESVLRLLLLDRTTNDNIVWGTTDYEYLGEDYGSQSPIREDIITGLGNDIIQPRIFKEKTNKISRTKGKAEVLTPTWMCNEQNNLIDYSWFGRDDVFNTRIDGGWKTSEGPIVFDKESGKVWQDYVDARRLEITCGEAPYLVSRYDTVTGYSIQIADRIGLLDRKLRVIGENTKNESEWMGWTIRAFQSIYGFELQGDSLLLARENLLYTFIDYVKYELGRTPRYEELEKIADIISWNLWQMDGMSFTVPFSTMEKQENQMINNGKDESNQNAPLYCKIKDWRTGEILTYASLVQSERDI